MTTLTHRQPFQPVVVNINVTIRLDRLFWLIYGLVWLAWWPVAGFGRWAGEWWVSAVYGVRQAPVMMLEDWTRFWFKAGWSYA